MFNFSLQIFLNLLVSSVTQSLENERLWYYAVNVNKYINDSISILRNYHWAKLYRDVRINEHDKKSKIFYKDFRIQSNY